MKLVKSVLIHTVLFGAGAVTAASCVNVNYPNPAYRCSPASGDAACPEDYQCCSDDPAAQDGDLPAYTFSAFGGKTPIFSDNNNILSTSGLCIEAGSISDTLLGNGCPIPCNPTWDPTDVATVCGPAASCCQTTELNQIDCVFDDLDQRWRTVNGGDIGKMLTRGDGMAIVINWTPDSHATHQDPEGVGCRAFTQDPNPNSDVNIACYQQLSVADQRGFCDARACSCVEDICGQMNADYVPRCLGAAM
ncbi:MAG: hypothetical protein KC636_09980 [Myxococcales bacterium]|nr:hypothetical protein [Myxococcales bacterium]